MTVLDLRDLDLPIYDPDLSIEALPQGVRAMRQMLAAHDGFLMASPEYHGSLPPLLKNALDWSASATFAVEALTPIRNKPAALMSVAQDTSRGFECLSHLRLVLGRMGVLVLHTELTFPASIFSGDSIRDPTVSLSVRQHVRQLIAAISTRE